MRVGFIGLGLMGKPMSHNLLKAGFPLTVHNRSRGKVEEVVAAGATAAGSPAEVAEQSDVVLACLPTVAATEEVFLGRDQGVVPHCRTGQILVDHSTIGPGTARRIAAAAAERGATFLDAPISGGVERAEDGTLTMMVGGDEEAFRWVEPVFRAMGQRIHWVGGVGAGCVVKLVNQLLTAVHAASAAEAMVLGTKAGADPESLFDILVTSWGQSRMLERSVPRILGRDFSPKAPLRLLWKDLALIQELAEEGSAPLPLTDAAVGMFRQALEMGLAESDLASLVLPLERRAGVQVAPRRD